MPHPRVHHTKHHDDQYIESYNDSLAQLCSSRKLSQVNGSGVCVTYSLLQQAYGKYMWMPLTLCTPCGQYFGLITIEQKQLIDSEFTKECMLMNPNKFIAMVQLMTLENRFDSFIRLLKGD